MNQQSSNGWPPTTGPSAPPPGAEVHPQMQQRHIGSFNPGHSLPQGPALHMTAPVLPPPGPVYTNQPNGQSLHTLASLTQASPLQSTRPNPVSQQHMQHQQSPPVTQRPPHQGHPTTQQMSGYPLPAINHAIQQRSPHSTPSVDREREYRAHEMREMDERQRQQDSIHRDHERERELREIQQPPLEAHTGPIPLQQPVASRMNATLHGPNGILSSNPNVGVGMTASSTLSGAPNGAGYHLANGIQSTNENVGRALLQHQNQNIPPQQLLGFNAGMVPQNLPIGMGQQPILNDALSYLDQVKVRFVEQPDVYNKFLDIMKDFKSQAIDTPGVIERVSNLFTGHPELIQGFNTFLPPGYKIECGTQDDPNSIRVTTPMGTTVSQMPSNPNHLNGGHLGGLNGILTENLGTPPRQNYPENNYRPLEGNWGHRMQADGTNESAYSPATMPRSLGIYALEQPQNRPVHETLYGSREDDTGIANSNTLAHQPDQQGVSQLQSAVSAAANGVQIRPSTMQLPSGGEPAMTLGQVVAMNNEATVPLSGQYGGALEKRGPVEFNHAISYVNKIKNRFATEPEIYKQFLEILQTYQRESKPIQDVYAQVTQLFNAAPDLLEDFKQFLPESAAQAKAQAAARQATEDAAMLSNVRGDPNYVASIQPAQVQTPRPDTKMPTMGIFAPPPSVGKENKKRKGGPGSQITGGVASSDVGSLTVNQNSRMGTMPNSGNAAKRVRVQPTKSTNPDMPVVSPTLIPDLPHPLPPTTSLGGSQDEIAFFDRVRKFIANKQTFNEFLKLCNLFAQDLIDKNVLVNKAANFFGGNPDLMGWFQTFVLFNGRDEVVVNKPIQSETKVVLSNCRALGPSYRLLPKRERLKRCTGRDEMCEQVLNDEWASHPTWASEDSGFQAHRKNIYEEALHRMEEERHDYDFNIETCLRTIQLLEPIVQQIKIMNDDEKASYRLPQGIGGQSEAIYQRVIKKIYDRQRGGKVIEDMFSRPASVCPIVLSRLKQKAAEWKAGQQEWEKVWREQTHKQFWKSLDHQGLNAKSENKRQFQPKSLQTDIQTKYEEQKRQRMIKWAQIPKYQFEYHFDDPEVTQDACHVLLTYLHFLHAGNHGDQAKVQNFFKTFIPAFFGLDREAFQRRMNDIYDASPPTEEMDEDTPVNDDPTVHRGRRATNGKKGTLLRGVLDRGSNGKTSRKDKDHSSLLESKESTPDVTSMEEDSTTPVETPNDQSSRADFMEYRWMEHPQNARNRQDLRHNEPFTRDSFSLYANLNIYCFMRMFQLFYERLIHIKDNEKQVHEDVRRAKANKTAVELKMADKSPSEYFADTSVHANYYQQVLKMCEDVAKGEDEMNHLEDTLRRFYMQHGWQLYNFDKILAAIIRFALQILANDTKDRSSDIINHFYKNRRENETTHQAEIEYRKQVEKLAKDSDIYRIVYNRPTRRVTMQIFKRDDKTFETDEMTLEAMWSYYVSSYVMRDRTEGIPVVIQWPFLRRNTSINLRTEDELNLAYAPQWNEDGLVIRICPNNYHLLYDTGSADWWVHHDKVSRRGLKGMNDIKEERTQKFREKFGQSNSWMEGLSPDEIGSVNEKFRSWINNGTARGETKVEGTSTTVAADGDKVMSGME